MLLARTENPTWLSNAYLVAEGPGGSGVLVDGNGVADELVERIESDGIAVTHVLLTHGHGDHVAGVPELAARFGVPVLAHPEAGVAGAEPLAAGDTIASGGLEVQALATPGHAPGHLALLVDGADCLTGDVLFRGTVGGTRGGGPAGFADLRRSVMERLLTLPPETRLHPGHREPTTVADEWERNPFVRVWRGLDPEGDEPCTALGEPATLVLLGDDYDGGHKAWVRWPDGRDDIVPGSQVKAD